MSTPRFDVTPFLHQDEGQHFDRKSLLEGPEGSRRPRDRRTVRDQIAEYVAAFANAEGGVLILGIEDGGAVTGHRYPASAVRAMLQTPRARLRPPQPEGFGVEHKGQPLLVFDVPASDVPVQVDGDGFPLRMGDRTVQASETQIRALKFRGLAESWEARPSPLSLSDLDPELLARARAGAGLSALTDEEYLLKRKLADRRGRGIGIRRAAELLFAKDGPDHPNAGVRVFRVIGTERRFGVEHNVEEKPRIEGNLTSVLEAAFAVIEGLIRRPSRLRGTRFHEVPEYPEFSWKEAILNAAAHRDYSVEGRTTEVWFFEDRLEVTSPGGLIPDLTLAELLRLERRHMSRNPRVVRALVDLGLMRDQGEGIPRMFAEMEGLFLPAPAIEVGANEFAVTLRNTPTLTEDDRAFVASLGAEELSDDEFRALLEAHRRGRVDNGTLRRLSGLDTLAASALLRRLRDRGLLTLHAAGPASYYELGAELDSAVETATKGGPDLRVPEGQELVPDGQEFDSQGHDLSRRQGHNLDLQGLDLPLELKVELRRLPRRAPTERLRALIVALCEQGPIDRRTLGLLLQRSPGVLVRKHLTPMVRDGLLALTHPETPNHPGQAYQAAKRQGKDEA